MMEYYCGNDSARRDVALQRPCGGFNKDIAMQCLHNNTFPIVFCYILTFFVSILPANAQSVPLSDSMSTTIATINALLNLDANNENNKNFAPKLIDFLKDFREQKTKISQKEQNYLAYSYLGYSYALDGKHPQALLEYENGRRFLADARPYNKFLGHFYLLRAKALLQTGDKERGLQSLEDAKEVFTLNKRFHLLDEIHQIESDYFSQHGQPELAIAALGKNIEQNRKNPSRMILPLLKRGQLFSQSNQYEKADDDFNTAEQLIDNHDLNLVGEINAAKAQHLLRQDKNEKALALYDEALEQLCPGIRKEKFAAFPNCTNPIAFLETLQWRGEIIQESIAKNTETVTLKNLYNNYITGLRYLQFLQKSGGSLMPKELSDEQFSFFLEKGIESCFMLNEAHPEQDVYLQNAISLANLNKQPDSIQSILITDLQQLASQQKTTFLSFFYGKLNLFAFVVSPKNKQFIKIDKGTFFEENLRQLIAFHHLPLQSIADINMFKDLSYDLHQTLFTNLKLPTKKLLIIPDGLLSYLSFESFIVNLEKADKHPLNYLLFNKNITYSHSFSQLQKDLNTPPLETRAVFTFAPMNFKKDGLIPLKGTPGHIRFLETKFLCKKWIKEEATTANFKIISTEEEKNIAVFTTHTEAGKEPWICFHDKNLLVSDLPKMKANLAVFSSCNTSVTVTGETKSAIDFSKPLSDKGIPTTIAPLWPVQHQRTVQLLEYFYLNLASGMKKDKAMAAAKISYLNNCGNDAIAASPHFWAATIMTGNTESLYESSYLLPLIILGLLFLLGFTWKRAQRKLG